jgi:hypothetical protein
MNDIIYCISGLGADKKVFSKLVIPGYELVYIPWLVPIKNEAIEAYASRMASIIEHPQPIILGVSFGGMIAIEIAKQRTVQHLIIVSSIQSVADLPGWMKMAGKLKLNRVIPARTFKLTQQFNNNRLGVSTNEEREMVRAYRRDADPFYLQWAIDKVINWKNDWRPEKIIHIHGDRDKIFPIKKLKPTHSLKEGTHMIIYNRAEEIGQFIHEALK